MHWSIVVSHIPRTTELLSSGHISRIHINIDQTVAEMGSLMSGWSSSVLSDKEVRLMRNRSLTKDEVAAFWRRQQQQQYGRPTAPEPNAGSPRAADTEMPVPLTAAKRRLEATRSLPPLRTGRGGTRSNDDDLKCCSAYGYGGAGDQQQQLVSSRSVPPSPAAAAAAAAAARREGFFLPENDDAGSSGTSRGWWTRSSWAFLNEPPLREEVLLGRAQGSFARDQLHAARIVTGNA